VRSPLPSSPRADFESPISENNKFDHTIVIRMGRMRLNLDLSMKMKVRIFAVRRAPCDSDASVANPGADNAIAPVFNEGSEKKHSI
jgi:hypothetical protein